MAFEYRTIPSTLTYEQGNYGGEDGAWVSIPVEGSYWMHGWTLYTDGSAPDGASTVSANIVDHVDDLTAASAEGWDYVAHLGLEGSSLAFLLRRQVQSK